MTESSLAEALNLQKFGSLGISMLEKMHSMDLQGF